MQKATPVNRRRFLTVLGSVVAVTACGDDDGDGSPATFGSISAGTVQDVAIDALVVVAGQPVVLGRDANGLYAMTITCTHQGCDIEPTGTGASATLDCPCHGSIFDRNGAVLHGPARSPLVHFAVEVDATGAIIIHGDTRVAADVRTAVA